jgi:pyrroloquinoline quinone (PQQ) biosynthesis protein C
VSWPPKIGDPLPRADRAWFDRIKLEEWVFAEQGHGTEWRRVFRVGFEDREQVWKAISMAVLGAPVATVRDRTPFGVVCGVVVDLSLNRRQASVTLSWHYAYEGAAPRLVTAYPTL